MRAFSEFNPIAVFIQFAAIVIIAMFIQNPVMVLISLIGAVLFYISIFRKMHFKMLCFWISIFVLITLINPIFSHNGETVLFFINGKAVTLESLLYGANNALMILSVMIWFISFSEIMTSDRVMYIFGKISPRLALFVSMSLRYIPLYRLRATEINNTQKVMGLYKNNNIVDDVRGGMRIFSSLITWSLETSVDTADSFRARGGELSGRSSFSLFKFRKADTFLIVISILLFSAVIAIQSMGILSVDYYSSNILADKLDCSLFSIVAYNVYFILTIMPFSLERFSKR